jgi:hypothetical protein
MLKLFAHQRRNDFSAEAIAARLPKVVRDTEQYPVEFVAEILDEFKASGDFDRLVAEE